ncbi:hypothetical protein ANO11243_017990 [Dothideomycetidae sp. 11243]|nr:hypothetical protein ANO11243_017990 [fungal sp. No.11243]
MEQYTKGLVSPVLLSAVFAVTSGGLQHPEILALGGPVVGARHMLLVRQACSPIWLSEAPAALSDLKAMFLLALFEFRSALSSRACVTIGHLVRLAYQYGIHQVDGAESCSFETSTTSSADQEGWRYLWWSIYMLDTFCNLAAGIPSNIDIDAVCTALPMSVAESGTLELTTSLSTRRKLFLRSEVDSQIEILTAAREGWMLGRLDEGGLDPHFGIRVVITAQVRAAWDLRRTSDLHTSTKFQKRQQLLSNGLAATRLSLPGRYFDPRRAVSLDELPNDHRIRLVNLLEMTLSRLPVMTIRNDRTSMGPDDEWLVQWDGMLDFVHQGRVEDDSGCVPQLMAGLAIVHATAWTIVGSASHTGRFVLSFTQVPSQPCPNKRPIAAAERFQRAASEPLSLHDASLILQKLQKPVTAQPRPENSSVTVDSSAPLDLGSLIDFPDFDNFCVWMENPESGSSSWL